MSIVVMERRFATYGLYLHTFIVYVFSVTNLVFENDYFLRSMKLSRFMSRGTKQVMVKKRMMIKRMSMAPWIFSIISLELLELVA